MMTFDIVETNITNLYKYLLLDKNKIGINIIHILNHDTLKYNVSKEAYKVYISIIFMETQTCIDLDEIFNFKFLFKEDHIVVYKSYHDKYKYIFGIDNYKIDPKEINRKPAKTHTLDDLKRVRGYNLNTFK